MAEVHASVLPDPDEARDLAEFIALLDQLRVWSGDPSFRVLARQVGPLLRPPQQVSKSTVADMFQPGRRRLNQELVVAVVRALGLDGQVVDRWRTACARVHVSARTGEPGAARRSDQRHPDHQCPGHQRSEHERADRQCHDHPARRFERVTQLPAAVTGFAGRRDELGELVAALDSCGELCGQLPVVAVTGGGGLGKTALAVQAAHLVAGHFPDGQFYADLRAADPAPREPRDVLRGWLRAVGERVDPDSDVDECAARWRGVLHDRHALLLLDNAVDADQVRPLLPAAATCAVVVTSRNRMPELPGVRTLCLSPLSDEEALDLLAVRVGRERVALDRSAAVDLVRACGGIPLAVHIAGARLAARPAWPLGALGARLRDERRRLDELCVGDLAVRASLRMSYTALGPADGPAAPARAFRLLGLAPGVDICVAAAAALLGATEEAAERALEVLVDANLLETRVPGRYRLHDLLRLYAVELAEQQESAEVRAAAQRRIVDWYLSGTADAIVRFGTSSSVRPPGRGALAEELSGRATLAWYEAEHANLAAAVAHAVDAVFEER